MKLKTEALLGLATREKIQIVVKNSLSGILINLFTTYLMSDTWVGYWYMASTDLLLIQIMMIFINKNCNILDNI